MADDTTTATAAPVVPAGPADPFRNFNFKLDVGGSAEAAFMEVSGLAMRVHPIRYRESGSAQLVRALPGPVEYAEVRLRFGLTRSRLLWDWMTAIARGKVERRNVSIMLLEIDGSVEAMRWNLRNAWPCEWRGAPLDALGRDVAIEELSLAYDELQRE